MMILDWLILGHTLRFRHYFVVGIGLLFSLATHTVYAQSGDCEGMPVRFAHADLESPTARQLTLSNCIPDACLSRTTVKKTTLQLRWGLNETYTGTAAAFRSQVDVTVTGYAADNTPLISQEVSLQINQDQPEQYYRIDVYEPVRYFSIVPKNYQADPLTANYIRLDALYRVTTETDVAGLSVSGLSETLSGWEAQLRWQTGTCPAPSYEVQIVRLYDNASPTVDTWRTALSVLTEQRTPSLSLTLAEGSGGYAWRVRPLGTREGGAANPANWGNWSSERQFSFRQPDEEKNWIYSRTFTEGGKLSEQITFANGLQQVQQQQTRLQQDKQVIASQTVQDFVGRSALTTLPIPIKDKQTLGYEPQLLRPMNQTTPYAASDFDQGSGQQPTAARHKTGYYSGQDNGINAGVPDAEGFPYQRTLFHNDGTGRAREVAGAGATHSVVGGKTVRTYYAGVAQAELDPLFGDEAPDAASAHKIIQVDPNNTASITYQSKDGQVLATALSVGSSSALESLPSQAGAVRTITETVTDPGNSRKPLFFTTPTQLTVDYRLTPQTVAETCTQRCQSCDYRIQILLHYADDPTNSQVVVDHAVAAGSCSNVQAWNPGPTTIDVAEGSYVLEKRIEAYQRNAGGTPYVTAFVQDVLADYEAELDADLATINDLVDQNDAEGLYQHLAATHGPLRTEGDEQYYEVPLVCGDVIRVPYQEDACEEEPSATDPQFEAFFAELWNGRYDLSAALRTEWAKGVYVEFSPGDFDAMVGNMANDGYDVQLLWQAWQQQVRNYENLLAMNGTTTVLDDGKTITYEYQLLEAFLQGVQALLEETRQVTDPEDPRYDLYEPGTFIRKNEEVPAGQQLSAHEIYKAVYYDLSVPVMKSCWDGFGGSFPSSNAVRYQLYNCLKYADTEATPPTEAELEQKRESTINTCNTACEDRSKEFRAAVIDELLQKNTSTKIENYRILTNAWLVEQKAGGTPRPKYLGVREEGTHTDDYTVAECELDAMVASLVEHCQTYCDMTLVRDDEGRITGLGIPEEIANVQKAMTYGFEVQESIGSCSGEFDKVEVSASALSGGGKTPEEYLQERLDAFEFGAIAEVSDPNDFDNDWTVTKTTDPYPFDYDKHKDDPNSEMYGTLQWAMRKARESLGSDLIQFDIPGEGPHIISIYNALPDIIGEVAIDGNTQTRQQLPRNVPRIKIVGEGFSSSAPLFMINKGGQNSKITGLEIDLKERQGGYSSISVHNSYNISISNNVIYSSDNTGGYTIGLSLASGCTISGNVVGTDLSYSKLYGGNYNTIDIKFGCSNNIIGGKSNNEGNIIANSKSSGINALSHDGYELNQLNMFGNNIIFSSEANLKFGIIMGSSVNDGLSSENFATKNNVFIDHGLYGFLSRSQRLSNLRNYNITRYDFASRKAEGFSYPDATIELFLTDDGKNLLKYLGTSTADSQGDWEASNIAIPPGMGIAITAKADGYNIDATRSIFPENTCPINRTLCFRWTAPPKITPPEGFEVYTAEPTPCAEVQLNYVRQQIASQTESLLSKKEGTVKETYRQQCAAVANISDQLTLIYELGYHHYTLYYYDRSGNLVKTVPPAGVKADGSNNHSLLTTYAYNSLGQLVSQQTPDAGTTQFYYNAIGQLRFSQNAQQQADGTYSYTKYDALGRITEVGESTEAAASIAQEVNRSDFPTAGTQRTVTVYNQPATITYLDDATYARLRNQGWAGLPKQRSQRYLQNRVSYSYLDEDGDDNTLSDRHYSYYSYDAHGNVEWLVQDVAQLGRKHLRYAYDLLSGNVRQVYYQEGQADAFYHRYEYDADNRLLAVETSTNGYHWEQDAAYDYYAHGPLRRVELGHERVQGIDYTYTIHGWLKAINHPVLNPNADPGADGPNGTGQDAFGMSLGYYQGDYKNNQARYQSLSANSDALIDRNLYNGNIAAWASDAQENQLAVQQGNLKYTGLTGQQYQYDELNRLAGSSFRQYQNGSWQSPASAGEYGSTYSYDASGNLQTLHRNAFGSNPLIDRLQYHYQAGTNKLDYVTDAAGHPTIRDDFQPGQQAGNYGYDAIGNLTKDEQEGITKIDWTVYGKVQQVSKQDGSETTYSYDASGNRSSKQHVNAEGQQETTYYVRDASGNVMAIYQASGEERCLIGEVRATKRYDPSAWEDGELTLGQVKEVYLPQEIALSSGSSGNHELTLYYTDENNTEQTVLYQGGASASHAYNQAGTSRNEAQYQQGQRYLFQSSTSSATGGQVVRMQSVRVSINNGDSWDPSGQTSVVVKLYEACAGLTLAEQPIYGSERLGMYRAEKLLSQEQPSVTPTGNVAYITGDIAINDYEGINEYVLAEGVTMTVGQDFSYSYQEQQQEFSISFGDIETQGQYYARETGKKQYELKDHLGNVRVLVSDKKLSEDTDGDGVGDVSKAEVLASYEYYAFGMLQPGRTFNPSESRHTFNGMESDDEVYGIKNLYTALFWQYDSRIGRRWNVDPVIKFHESPFSAFANNPILFIDPLGNDTIKVHADGSILVDQTNRSTDHFFYTDGSGRTHNLGSFEKNANGLIQLPSQFDYTSGNLNIAFSVKNVNNSYVSNEALGALFGVLAENNTTDLAIVHFSKSDGSSPQPSTSHKNGNTGDMRFLRTDQSGGPVNVWDPEIDWDRQVDLNRSLRKFGWRKLLSEGFSPGGGVNGHPLSSGSPIILPYTRHYSGKYNNVGEWVNSRHYHHLHIGNFTPNVTRFRRPSPIEKIQSKGFGEF